jgi:hypothetical protein
MDLSNVVPIGITATASFVGAWLAARFALYRFYKEKVWERKAAYTAIFEALHDMEKWFDAHISARRKDHEIPDDETERIGKEYRAARDLLERRLAAESWLLPDTSRTILNDMSYRLAHQPKADWLDTVLRVFAGGAERPAIASTLLETRLTDVV